MDFSKLTIFGGATLVVFYLFWAAMHDIAHGEQDPTFEYAALGVCLVVLLFLCYGAEAWLPAGQRALWLAGTGFLVLLYDAAAVNAILHPTFPSDPALGAGVLLAGVPLAAWLAWRLLHARAWELPWTHRRS